jgi:hypothetical protein
LLWFVGIGVDICIDGRDESAVGAIDTSTLQRASRLPRQLAALSSTRISASWMMTTFTRAASGARPRGRAATQILRVEVLSRDAKANLQTAAA